MPTNLPQVLLIVFLLCGEADCHVASLLAMTGKRQTRTCGCKDVLPGQVRRRLRICLGAVYFSMQFTISANGYSETCARKLFAKPFSLGKLLHKSPLCS